MLIISCIYIQVLRYLPSTGCQDQMQCPPSRQDRSLSLVRLLRPGATHPQRTGQSPSVLCCNYFNFDWVTWTVSCHVSKQLSITARVRLVTVSVSNDADNDITATTSLLTLTSWHLIMLGWLVTDQWASRLLVVRHVQFIVVRIAFLQYFMCNRTWSALRFITVAKLLPECAWI